MTTDNPLEMANVVKTVADQLDKEVEKRGFDPTGTFRLRLRKALQSTAGVTDSVEQMRGALALSHLLEEEIARVDSEIVAAKSKATSQTLRTGQYL